MNFKPFITAKLKPRHIAKLCKVARVTASRWLHGHAEPHPQILPRVEAALMLVSAAVANKTLPFPKDLPQLDEVPYLQRVLRELVKTQK